MTGANQGLGLALVRGLCRRLGADGIVYLTARDRGRGERAAAGLEAEGLSPRLEMLDLRDDASVMAQALGERHGGVDIVVSNAAARIFPQVPADQQVRAFVDTDHGTPRMIQGSGHCSTTAPGSSWWPVRPARWRAWTRGCTSSSTLAA